TWMDANAKAIENGKTRLEADGTPELRYLLVPVGEAELLDTWHTRGMRGTGTHHFNVHDVFVPDERTVRSATATLLEEGPLYKIPRTLCFASGATAAYEDHLIQRHFQDIHVITQHLQGRMAHYEMVGRYWLGLPIDEARL